CNIIATYDLNLLILILYIQLWREIYICLCLPDITMVIIIFSVIPLSPTTPDASMPCKDALKSEQT
ncbi:hypothetical protein, partial [Yersinia mollaretii]|uniref:hypothetical protein n=1 Tax=Yersinia mollaretii TaxID=33060 RepID=UPI001C982339